MASDAATSSALARKIAERKEAELAVLAAQKAKLDAQLTIKLGLDDRFVSGSAGLLASSGAKGELVKGGTTYEIPLSGNGAADVGSLTKVTHATLAGVAENSRGAESSSRPAGTQNSSTASTSRPAVAVHAGTKRKAMLTFGDDDDEDNGPALPSHRNAASLGRAAVAAPQSSASTAATEAPSSIHAGSAIGAGASGKDVGESPVGGGGSGDGAGQEPPAKRARLGRDPTVSTSFLRDPDAARQEAALTSSLEAEWESRQEGIKKDALEVTYSYWDGTGHRRSIVVQKGTSVGKFLELARQDLSTTFPELRTLSSDALLFVKEDLILPHATTFYSLIVSKARGKSGPLFQFDVHDDVRLVGDARIEKDESHPGKVVRKAWYASNKHVFPASRWEVYDPTLTRQDAGYTTHGREVR